MTRLKDLGTTGHQVHTRTHLGHILHPGDVVLGWVMSSAIYYCNYGDTVMTSLLLTLMTVIVNS